MVQTIDSIDSEIEKLELLVQVHESITANGIFKSDLGMFSSGSGVGGGCFPKILHVCLTRKNCCRICDNKCGSDVRESIEVFIIVYASCTHQYHLIAPSRIIKIYGETSAEDLAFILNL